MLFVDSTHLSGPYEGTWGEQRGLVVVFDSRA